MDVRFLRQIGHLRRPTPVADDFANLRGRFLVLSDNEDAPAQIRSRTHPGMRMRRCAVAVKSAVVKLPLEIAGQCTNFICGEIRDKINFHVRHGYRKQLSNRQ